MAEHEQDEDTCEEPTERQAATVAPWRVASARVIGAKHEAVGKVCQDAVRCYSDERCAVVAVADGHGDPRYERSEIGSELACEVAVAFFVELAQDIEAQGRHFKEWERELRLRVPGRLSWLWNRAVREHAGHVEPDGQWHEDVDLYGTTLLAALVTRRCVVLFQIGDGDTVLISQDGVRCAFPPDPTLFGNLTWSMAQIDAPAHAEVMCLDPRGLRLMLLCSDGIRDAFAKNPQAFLGVGRWLDRRVQDEGIDAVRDSLPPWLSELSQRGNGDDATIGMLRL